jgi:hypothetical protein
VKWVYNYNLKGKKGLENARSVGAIMGITIKRIIIQRKL